MGFYDPEASLPNRVSQAMNFGYRVNDTRRRLFFLTVSTLFILLLIVSGTRHAPVRGWIDQHRIRVQASWTSTATSSPLDPTYLYSDPGSPSSSDQGPVLGNGERKLSKQSLKQLRNSTLGFGSIQVVNIKDRTDRLDAMRLTSSLLGFHFDITTAVNGADVSEKLLTGDLADGKDRDGAIGCWQSHIAAARNIIEKDLSSGLILEDDADYDVSLRSQLELFALGSQALLDTPKGTPPESPYGDGWDLLWIGNCATKPTHDDNRRVLIKNDPTATPLGRRTHFGEIPDMSPYDNTTRIIYFNEASLCTYGYALSLHGARKILKYMSLDLYGSAVDFGLMKMCGDTSRNFKCISVFPQLVAEHKPAGKESKDSDIGHGGGKIRDVGFSYNIVHSARLNADALMDGRYEDITSQWPEDTPHLTGPVEMEYIDEYR